MKNLAYIFFSLTFLICCTPKTEKRISEKAMVYENNNDIEKIILNHVYFGIFTIVDVPCEDFEIAFGKEVKKDTITDKNEIVLLKTYVHNLELFDDSLCRNSIDSRAKLFFISSLDTTIFCLDNFILYSNDKYYKTPKELVEYIENIQK